MVSDGRQRLGRSEQQELLERARVGTPGQRREALEALLDDFHGPAMAVIHKTLAAHDVGQEHADSVLQQATVKFLARGLRDYRQDAAPRSYFYRIAINAALDTCRRVSRSRGQVGLVEAVMPGRSEGPEAALLRREGAQRLLACLERLAEHYRLAVELFYLDEVGDAATCAGRVGISVQAFWQRLSRARVMLADCMRRGAVLGSEES